jgi:hypothetical protein
MHFLKRIELWVLLAVIVAGLAWVFTSGPGDEEDLYGGSANQAAADSQAPLQLHRCVLTRDYGNARLDIDLRVRNDSAEKLVMTAPKVKLLAAGGREIPEFFLIEPRPEVVPNSTQDVQLRYWLEASDLQGPLSLDVNGKILAIKGSAPFDLTSMRNEEEKVIQKGGW